jgi:hypothetical protein
MAALIAKLHPDAKKALVDSGHKAADVEAMPARRR